MNAEQIKQAVSEGKKVFWKNLAYTVIADRSGFLWVEYLDGHKSPLLNSKGVMNEKPEDFYTLPTA